MTKMTTLTITFDILHKTRFYMIIIGCFVSRSLLVVVSLSCAIVIDALVISSRCLSSWVQCGAPSSEMSWGCPTHVDTHAHTNSRWMCWEYAGKLVKMSFQWPKAQVCSVTCCPHSKRLKKKRDGNSAYLLMSSALRDLFFCWAWG